MLKFIPRTSDFADFLKIHSADFCKNSFRGPRSSRTFVKIHPADLGFCGLLSNSFRGPLISRTSSQVRGVREDREVRGIHLAFKRAHDTDNDCSSLPLKLFVLNNHDAKLTSDFFSVLNSCEICPGQIFTLLLEDKYLLISRCNIKRTG